MSLRVVYIVPLSLLSAGQYTPQKHILIPLFMSTLPLQSLSFYFTKQTNIHFFYSYRFYLLISLKVVVFIGCRFIHMQLQGEKIH